MIGHALEFLDHETLGNEADRAILQIDFEAFPYRHALRSKISLDSIKADPKKEGSGRFGIPLPRQEEIDR
jgi:hypothetical protein